jgi:hypothetical protein
VDYPAGAEQIREVMSSEDVPTAAPEPEEVIRRVYARGCLA